jgi:putative glutamine amidotransferase
MVIGSNPAAVGPARRPLIAITGRRLGETDRWPHSRAMVSPRGYPEAVTRAGGLPALIDCVGDPHGILDHFDGLVVTGGPDLDPAGYDQAQHAKTYGIDANIDAFELALTRDAIAREMPTLAICRGLQVLNVALGGTLHQHILEKPGVPPHGRPGEPNGGREHEIPLDSGTLLEKVMGASPVVASCHHHQSVDRVGTGLRVSARADDGIVEALELDHTAGWLLAVQWHPEDTAWHDPAQQRLFDALVTECL